MTGRTDQHGNSRSHTDIPESPIYVTMKDQFMSNWGTAAGLTNRLVVLCETWMVGAAVARRATDREEMSRITITSHRPAHHFQTLYSWTDSLTWTAHDPAGTGPSAA